MFKRSVTQKVVVTNAAGLHARPCLAIVNTVRRFKSRVEIRSDKEVVDANEILQLMSLGAAEGTELVLTATGPDAQQVIAALVDLFANHFGLY
jgi:phosphotransferase system HPr (HPr) family protein